MMIQGNIEDSFNAIMGMLNPNDRSHIDICYDLSIDLEHPIADQSVAEVDMTEMQRSKIFEWSHQRDQMFADRLENDANVNLHIN